MNILTMSSLTFNPFILNNALYAEGSEIKQSQLEENSLGIAIYNGTMSAIEHIALQGGYNKIPEPNKIINIEINRKRNLPIYFNKGEVKIPKLEKIADEIESAIDERMPIAIEQYAKFPNLKNTKSKTKVSIEKEKIIIGYNLEISYENKTKKINEKLEYISKIGGMYEMAEYITNSNKENPNKINISELQELAIKNRLRIEEFFLDNKNPNLILTSISHFDAKKPRLKLGAISSIIEDNPSLKPIDYTFPKSFIFLSVYKLNPLNSAPVAPPPKK